MKITILEWVMSGVMSGLLLASLRRGDRFLYPIIGACVVIQGVLVLFTVDVLIGTLFVIGGVATIGAFREY